MLPMILQRVLVPACFVMIFGLECSAQSTNDQAIEKKGTELLLEQANNLKPIFASDLAKSFLDATSRLPKIAEREILVDRENPRLAIDLDAAAKLSPEERARFESKKLDEHFYYFTRYGSPLVTCV